MRACSAVTAAITVATDRLTRPKVGRPATIGRGWPRPMVGVHQSCNPARQSARCHLAGGQSARVRASPSRAGHLAQSRPRESADPPLRRRAGLRGRTLALLPDFVRAELQDYLGCGLLQRGFALVTCKGCQERHLVAFSCRSRSFCPSCMGRRMAAITLNLLAHVVPRVGLRQFVFTVPHALRARLAYDGRLLGAVSRIFVDSILGWYRRRMEIEGAARPAPSCAANRSPSSCPPQMAPRSCARCASRTVGSPYTLPPGSAPRTTSAEPTSSSTC
jgi:hypothetical protein